MSRVLLRGGFAANVFVGVSSRLPSEFCKVIAFPNEVPLLAFAIGVLPAIDADDHQAAVAPKVQPTCFEEVVPLFVEQWRLMDSACLRIDDCRLETFRSASPLDDRVMPREVRPALGSGSNHGSEASLFRSRKNDSRRFAAEHFVNGKLFEPRLQRRRYLPKLKRENEHMQHEHHSGSAVV